jgi:hypothetical protein
MKISTEALRDMHEEGFLTALEAAKLVSVAPSTIRLWAQKKLVMSKVRNRVLFVERNSVLALARRDQ